MHTVNDNPKYKNDDPIWCFRSAYSLNENAVVDGQAADPTTGPLFQTLQTLGLPPDCMNRIKGTIAETARRVRGDGSRGRPDFPFQIHLFCQRKIVENAVYPVNYPNGGWGYFFIQKGNEFPSVSRQGSGSVIELYVYKEGA